MTDAAPPHELTCPACRVIDRFDGVEDGHLWNPAHYAVVANRRRFATLLRAQDAAADQITTFAGSMRFIYIHTILFGVWIAFNVGLAGVGLEFDKFPFGLLTMIVSLEAIFLSTFVMISQNRADAKHEVLTQHQWKVIQKEDQQNQHLLQLTQALSEHLSQPPK